MNFPQDHRNHPDNNTEWWYFAGIGELEGVGPTNYHVSFFRKFSRKLKQEIYFAHLGINSNGKFEFKEHKHDICFCDNSTMHFFMGNWDLRGFANRYIVLIPQFNMAHIAKKQPAEHGPGYYSITDMDARGSINGKSFKGKGWFDHEFFDFSSIQLATLEYTWFAVQLDTGIEIIIYILPRYPAKSFGSVCFPGGNTQPILAGDYCVRHADPGWELELPKYGMSLELEKITEEKIDCNLGPHYIEGTMNVSSRGKIGHGFFEITGGEKWQPQQN